MIIRPVQREDIPELSMLARKTYSETFGHTMTQRELEVELEATRSEKYFNSVIESVEILVAIIEDRLAGYIQICDVRYDPKSIEYTENDQAIHAIYVHSDFQGKGVGRALMDAAFQSQRTKSADNVYIDVFEENTRAVNFYHNYGFKNVGTIDVIIDGVKVGYDLVLMKSLPS